MCLYQYLKTVAIAFVYATSCPMDNTKTILFHCGSNVRFCPPILQYQLIAITFATA